MKKMQRNAAKNSSSSPHSNNNFNGLDEREPTTPRSPDLSKIPRFHVKKHVTYMNPVLQSGGNVWQSMVKEALRISIPSIISMFFVMMTEIINTIFIGNLNDHY